MGNTDTPIPLLASCSVWMRSPAHHHAPSLSASAPSPALPTLLHQPHSGATKWLCRLCSCPGDAPETGGTETGGTTEGTSGTAFT